jgi:hypothetical protein
MTMRDSNFFFLNANCFLVDGATNAAIYNLTDGAVYAIDAAAKNLLKQTENATSIHQVCDCENELRDQHEVFSFLEDLVDLGLSQL